jgi:type I restriction enzyme, S subunit
MRDDWRTVRLGDLFRVSAQRLGRHVTEPPIFALSKYEGIIPASQYFDRRIASASLDDYKLLHPGAWAYSTIHIDEGSIARNNTSSVGALSPMYTTMDWQSTDHDPRYAELLLRTPALLSEYKSRAQGTVNRRRSLGFRAFAAIEVELPPLAEQRRIVDLLGALNFVAERAQAVDVSASTTLEAVGRAVCADLASAPTVALADIADVVGGLTKDAKRDADPNLVDVPYLRVANVQRGWLDLSEMAVIKAPPSKVASLRLRGGDVLFNEGGDRDKLGRGWVWEGQLDPCIHQNHVLRARVTDAEFDPWFISIWGNGPFGRVWFEENGSQTTNLASVSLSTLRRFPVPAIPITDQHKIAAEHLATREVSRSATALRQRALAARAALFTDLLSGDHDLPASYDRFLDGAA